MSLESHGSDVPHRIGRKRARRADEMNPGKEVIAFYMVKHDCASSFKVEMRDGMRKSI